MSMQRNFVRSIPLVLQIALLIAFNLILIAIGVHWRSKLSSPQLRQDISEASTLERTNGCQRIDSGYTINVKPQWFPFFVSGDKNSIVIPSAQYCLRVGEQTILQESLVDYKRKDAFFEGDRMNVQIEKIRRLSHSEIDDDFFVQNKAIPLFNVKKPEAISFGAGRGAVLVELKAIDRPIFRDNYGIPSEHPMALSIKASKEKELYKEGRFIIDARDRAFFNAGHVKGAINLPFGANAKGRVNKVLQPEEMAEQGYTIGRSALPSRKSTEILVYGHNSQDAIAYNLVTLLRTQGFSNLLYFSPGWDHLSGRPYETPEKLAGGHVVDAKGVLEKLESAVVVDTRPHFRYAAGSIPGSVSNPYEQARDNLGRPMMSKGLLKIAELRKIEAYSVSHMEQSRKRSVIVIGEDKYDWSAIKAATWYIAAGYATYWYRNGMVEWRYINRTSGNAYPFERRKNRSKGAVETRPED